MKPIRVLVVDDEPLARERLTSLLSADAECQLTGAYGDGEKAFAAIREFRPELVFMGIHPPRLDGVELLARFSEVDRPRTILVSADELDAVRAFEAGAQDFLLKPFTDERFFTALRRAKVAIRSSEPAFLAQQVNALLEHVRRLERTSQGRVGGPAASERRDRLVIKADGALHFVPVEDVIWLEAQGDFVKVQTVANHQLVRETLPDDGSIKLDATQFMRIHRSFVVNLMHVQRVETALYGDYSVFMSDGTKLRLSRSFRGNLDRLIGQTPTA